MIIFVGIIGMFAIALCRMAADSDRRAAEHWAVTPTSTPPRAVLRRLRSNRADLRRVLGR